MGIKEKRAAAKLTQQELAEKLNVDRTTVTKWETGIMLPTADKLPKLAKALGCTIDELLGCEAAEDEEAS